MTTNYFECSDNGNADRFKAYYGDNVRYLTETGQWLKFTKTGWKPTTKFKLSKPVVRSIYDEAKKSKDNDKSKELGQHAKNSQSVAKQTDMLRLAAEDDNDMAISINQFDTDPYVINCKNGIVDLRTKTLLSHSPNQFHLKTANVNYDPNATCPQFDEFFAEIFNHDDSLIKYVGVLLGYSIMGLTHEQYLFLCYGSGANGKDTLLETIKYVLGDYAHNTDFETVLHTDKVNAVRSLEAQGELKGKRFVITAETGNSARFNEALIKKLTGGNSLVGTKLGKDRFTFTPSHKLWASCNHLPGNKDASYGMWRRIRVIPFTKTFKGSADIKGFREKILYPEAEGIFNRLVEWAYEYNTNGLPEYPSVCQQATEEYREDNDRLSVFLQESVVKDVNSWIAQKALYIEYCNWCETNYEDKTSFTYFKANLKERGGFNHIERKTPGMAYIGWTLKSNGL
jgi:putative DNA primase/helicase